MLRPRANPDVCKRGHSIKWPQEFTKSYGGNGGWTKQCRTCNAAYARERRARKAAARRRAQTEYGLWDNAD